jgi:acyl carrier protein
MLGGRDMNLEEQIISIIKDNIEEKYDITADTDLRNELGLDSFDTMMIINAIEDEFDITIDESDFDNIKIVLDIIQLLQGKYIIVTGVKNGINEFL